ncbi:MAG: amidohydrolase [Candidatus Binatia bacterium]|nr:MAG: amidohydrolase [Candidatus Binatia bacterium]
MREYRVISADSHIVEPPDLWKKWLPPEFEKRAPQLVKDEDGGDAWSFGDGGPPAPLGLVTVTAGRSRDQLKWTGARYDTINQGCFEATARVQEMDIDGVDAEVIYPPQRTMRHFMQDEDAEFHLAGIQAYNNWLAKDFVAKAPDRLVGQAQIPNLGVEAAIAEMRRARELGLRGVVISSWPSGKPFLDDDCDPFWAEAEKLGVPVSVHISLVHKGQQRERIGEVARVGKAALTGFSAAGLNTMPLILGEMIFWGVFDKFPNLKMVGVEVGAGWIPYFLEQMDDRYWRNRNWARSTLQHPPSEYFRRNWKVTFIIDSYAIQNRHAVGIKNMMWSTDYPHHGCDWPYSRKVIEDMFRFVPEEERHAILARNCAELYGLV